MPLQPREEVLDAEATIVDFERKLDRLRTLYEQFFMGIEKREPQVLLKDIVRMMHALDQIQIRNTGLRYRHRCLVQKFNTYRTYWNRTLRAIENGTYHRDLARMSRNLAKKGISLPSTGRMRSVAEVERAVHEAVKESNERGRFDTDQVNAISSSPETSQRLALSPATIDPAPPSTFLEASSFLPQIPLDEPSEEMETNPDYKPKLLIPPMRGGATAPRSATPATPQPATLGAPRSLPPSPPRPARPSTSGPLSEGELQSIYRRFVRAKEMCGEDTSSVRYESLVKSISQQMPKIQAQHPGRPIEFQVVIRAGRAILKAKPKE
jgi:hypothetical protein